MTKCQADRFNLFAFRISKKCLCLTLQGFSWDWQWQWMFSCYSTVIITNWRDMDLPLGLNVEQQVLPSRNQLQNRQNTLCWDSLVRYKYKYKVFPGVLWESEHLVIVALWCFVRVVRVWLTSEAAVSSDGFTNTTVSRTSLWYWSTRWPTGNRG